MMSGHLRGCLVMTLGCTALLAGNQKEHRRPNLNRRPIRPLVVGLVVWTASGVPSPVKKLKTEPNKSSNADRLDTPLFINMGGPLLVGVLHLCVCDTPVIGRMFSSGVNISARRLKPNLKRSVGQLV